MTDGQGDASRKGTRTNPGFGDPAKRVRDPSGTPDVESSAEPARDTIRDQEPVKLTKKRETAAPVERARHRRGTPLVEIEVVHEHGPAPSTDRPWRMLEIWTRNRIYKLDPNLHCVEVIDRASRAVVHDHPFLGMRMVGGQHREGESIELSHPFPRPGTEAVFEQSGVRGGSFSRTSAVTRVILRLHIITVAPSYVVPTWESISGSWPVYDPEAGSS